MRPLLLLCLVPLACGSKQRPQDAALKTQILAGDKKPIVLPAQTVDASRLAEDLDMRRIAFEPTARDMEKRATHFAMKMKVQIDGPQGVGSRSVEHVWRRAEGSQFSVRHAGAGDTVDWIIADHKAFVKHGKNEWREKPYTLEHADVLKRDVVLPLGELMATFAGGMTVSAPQSTKDNGRAAYRYTIDYDEKKAADVENGKAKTGQAHAVALKRDDVFPLALQGDVVVDKETGLVLTAELKATLGMEPIAAADKGPAVPQQRTPVKVKINWSLDGLNADDAAKLEPTVPEKAIVDRGFERPTPEVLGFFGGLKNGAGGNEHEEED